MLSEQTVLWSALVKMSVQSPAPQLMFNDVTSILCLTLQLHNVVILQQTRVTFVFIGTIPVVVPVPVQDQLNEVLGMKTSHITCVNVVFLRRLANYSLAILCSNKNRVCNSSVIFALLYATSTDKQRVPLTVICIQLDPFAFKHCKMITR